MKLRPGDNVHKHNKSAHIEIQGSDTRKQSRHGLRFEGPSGHISRAGRAEGSEKLEKISTVMLKILPEFLDSQIERIG